MAIVPHTPETLTGLSKANPAKTAVGLKAVLSSAKHVFGSTSVQRGTVSLLKVNQKDGFDCPSCAWPDPDGERSAIAEYCENGAKAIADEVMNRHTASPVLFQRYSVEELSQKSDHWLGQQGRLTHPLVLHPHKSHYEKISWDDAFRLVGQHLNALTDPNEAIFYTSGRTSNEAAFLYQLFAKIYGTNNMPDCSNMCHESSGEALNHTIGIGKATIKLDDIPKADLVIIMGQNPGTNHPRMLTVLEEAVRNGTKIISVNPLKETGLLRFKHPQLLRDLVTGGQDLTDEYLQLRINSDMALLKAWMKILLEQQPESLDADFIQQKTQDFALLQAELAKYDLNDLIEATGLRATQVQRTGRMIAKAQRIIVCWCMGLTQHKNAVGTIQDVVNLMLMKGSIGKEGAGLCPVRGHSNVQGDRTMGIYEKPKPAFLDKLKEVLGFDPPRAHGYSTVQAIEAMYQGRAKVFVGLGGNFATATPDTFYTAQAMQRCALTVHISTKLNRSHLITGQTALILPCLGRTEKDLKNGTEQLISVENTTGVVHASRGAVAPIADTLNSEPAIVAGIAQATVGSQVVNWQWLVEDYARIRDLIAKTVVGFDDFNQKIQQEGGFYLPNQPREGSFGTDTGKAKFTANRWQPVELKADEFLLATVRSHDQFNTTVYGLDDRYRGIFNERRVVFINPKDLRKHGFKPEQVIDIETHYDGQKRVAHRFVLIPYNIPQGCLASYFPETNVLVPLHHYADGSLTPIYKSLVVKIVAAEF
ncbi:MAG: FdhF/YdeP family oxidoreductase [Spirosomaceae bacterium]|nr:FdhF/YdeP family oxidoreductase [Spirosomataceae bacterium]